MSAPPADRILAALGDARAPHVRMPVGGSLPSAFAVSDLAQASIGAAGAALARYITLTRGGTSPEVHVDRDLASAWLPTAWKLSRCLTRGPTSSDILGRRVAPPLPPAH